MASLGGSIGDGGGGGRRGDEFVDTGYGTHDGAGNVEDDSVRHQEGTGWDPATGQVKTRFGHWSVGYDPVTGLATEGVTTGYSVPQEAADTGRSVGMADISAAAPGAATIAPALEQEVQTFFEQQRRQQPQQEQGAQAPEDTGQGVTERMEAGEYLEGATRTGAQAEAWRVSRAGQPPPPESSAGLERPPAHARTGEPRP